MRSLLFSGVAVLLSVTLFVPRAAGVFAASGVGDLAKAETAQADRTTCFGRPATLVGTSGDDEIVGTPGRDVIVTGGGNDVVRSRGGDDRVCGGPGDDRLSGGNGRDLLAGAEGNDQIVDGGVGGLLDLLLGGPDDDLLTAPRGGYSWDKILKGGAGADRLVNIDSSEGVLRGGPGPDTLTSLADIGGVVGGAGLDVLIVAGPEDAIVGLTGDGDQVRLHGTGRVYLVCRGAFGPFEVDLAAGTVRRVGAVTGDVITVVSRTKRLPSFAVNGSHGDDRISGSDRNDLLEGHRGNDILSGRGGHDWIAGSPGDDSITGGAGDDWLTGGADDDRLDGGYGPDLLEGWGGDDRLDGGHGRDWLEGMAGDDRLDGGNNRDRGFGGKGRDTCKNVEHSRTCSP